MSRHFFLLLQKLVRFFLGWCIFTTTVLFDHRQKQKTFHARKLGFTIVKCRKKRLGATMYQYQSVDKFAWVLKKKPLMSNYSNIALVESRHFTNPVNIHIDNKQLPLLHTQSIKKELWDCRPYTFYCLNCMYVFFFCSQLHKNS